MPRCGARKVDSTTPLPRPKRSSWKILASRGPTKRSAFWTFFSGKREQQLDWFAKAQRMGPRDPARWTWLDGRGHALLLLGRDEEAIRALISALDANPKNISSHGFLAAAYALVGRSEEAHAALAAYLERHPGTRVSTFRTLSPVPLVLTGPNYRQLRAHINEGLLKAGMPE